MFQVSGHSVMQGTLVLINNPNFQDKQYTFHFSVPSVRRVRSHDILTNLVESTVCSR